MNDINHDVEYFLASRLARLGAVLIDMLVIGLILLPIGYLLGAFDGITHNPPQKPPFMLTIIMALMNIFMYGLINWKLLKEHGQTIGKKALNIKIIHVSGELLKPEHVILKRYLPFVLIPIIPFLGNFVGLIGQLLIFGKEKRCLHDYLASSRVIKS